MVERDVGLERVMDVLSAVGDVTIAPLDDVGRVVGAELSASGTTLTQSVGKGGGSKASRAAVFELLEHAAYEGLLEAEECGDQVHASMLYGDGEYALDAVTASVVSSGEAYFAYKYEGTATSLWVPDPLASRQSPSARRLAVYFGNSTGWAAHHNREEAVRHAVFELYERDAVSAFIGSYLSGYASGWPVMLMEDTGQNTLAESLASEYGTKIHLREIPSIKGRCVVAFGDVDDMLGRAIIAASCREDLDSAAQHALLELEQELLVERLKLPFDGDTPDVAARALDRYPHLKTAADMHWLRDLRQSDKLSDAVWVEGLEAPALPSSAGDPEEAFVRRVWYDYSGASDVCVVQVYVPGLEKLHVLRHGRPVEPIARLRTTELLSRCRSDGFETRGAAY